MKEDLLSIAGIMDMFLLYGTALGAYREGKFIEGDDDIDLGSFDTERRDEIANKMREMGFEVSDVWDEWVGWRESQMIHAKRNTHVDIFFFEKQGDVWIANRAVEEEPFVLITTDKTEEVKLEGETFKMLSPAEEYLETCYDDWKTPSKQHGKLYHDLFNKPFNKTLYK